MFVKFEICYSHIAIGYTISGAKHDTEEPSDDESSGDSSDASTSDDNGEG